MENHFSLQQQNTVQHLHLHGPQNKWALWTNERNYRTNAYLARHFDGLTHTM